MAPRKPTLDELVRDAKADRGPAVDWEKVEAKLFPRVEREARAQAALGAYAGNGRAWGVAAVVIAAAAAIPFFVAHRPAPPLDAMTESAEPSAGTLASKDHNAIVHVTRTAGGTARELAAGDAIACGNTLDVRSGRAIFAHDGSVTGAARPTPGDPGGVTWALEDSSQAVVRSTRGTLILALVKGAIEAQVTPVPAGEAFAIDVEGTRVAVHGTHFRVERQGTRAIVDLGEGVVSIGFPPKGGATYGDLVTAPAHVELDSADPHGTLKITHEPARVHAGQMLSLVSPPKVVLAADAIPRPFSPAASSAPPPSSPPPPSASPPHSAAPGAPAPPPATQVVAPVPSAQLPAVDPNAQRTIIDRVRACARKNVEGADGVVITVSTQLELQIADDGMVSVATFDPPLKPEVSTCVSGTLYGTRFAQPGAVSVSIDVTP
jgi:hypothetical protein